MVDNVPPAWMAAFQTLRREIEEETLRDARDRRGVEGALMIVREIEVAPGDGPDSVPATVLDEDRRSQPERFPFRVDWLLRLPEAPEGPHWADLRYKTAANLWCDVTLAPRYVERGIFTSWDERHRGILYGPEADLERDRATRLNDLFERGAICLQAMPDLMKQRFSKHVSRDYWLQCLFELGCQGANTPLNTASKQIWCREETGRFAAWCRERELLFPVDWESREHEFRSIRFDLRDRDAEIPPSLLIREPTTYCVTLDDVLRQSLYMIDWLCEAADGSLDTNGTDRMIWTEAKVAAEKHLQRNPWPGLNALARLIGCSSATMSKARENSQILRAKEAEYSATRKVAMPSQLAESQRDGLAGDGDVGESVSVDEMFNRIIAVENDPKKRATLENMTPEKRREYVALLESDPDGEGFFDQKNPAVRERSRTAKR
ncbi:MAG: hypothetical protein NTZ32_08035 [Planctomycetales bacterium]|nr:hypothetical protein [Planctomycetales bacterium]